MTSYADEHSIRLVEDAATSMRNLKKDEDAVWVQGLQPEPDPAMVAAMNAVRTQREQAARDAAATYSAEAGLALSGCRREDWLKLPCVLGVLYAVALTARLAFLPRETTIFLEYPPTEADTWPTIRENSFLALFLPMAAVTLFGGASSAVLCLRFGIASQRFAPFLGIGMSFLAVVALLMDGVMLYRACPDTSASFCDLPFVSHWMCHAFRNVMVQLSFWTCSFVLDEVRMAPTVPFVWSILLALPPLSQAVFLASAIFGKSPNYGLLGGAEVIGAVVTIVMLVKLHKQKQFGVVQREKPKNQ